MPEIRRLPDLVIRQIAAGEVIERPASALKELLENALDAGARHIDVHLERAGKTLLQVRDDGHGIEADALPLALAKHATSKLSRDDLSDIHSFGFRGEALASIAAVAKVHILSRTATSDTAYEIFSDSPQDPRPARGELGTTVSVRDLFYATPARLKFLRGDRAEMSAIYENVRHIALCSPWVSYRVFDGDQLRLQFAAQGELGDTENTTPESLLPRLSEIFELDFLQGCYTVDCEHTPYRVYGYCGPAALHRGRADRQFLAVNNRVIRDRSLMGAVRAAYGDLLPKGRYPQFVLFVDCDPAWLDVNVHPAKTEVRFRDQALLRSLLINAIRVALDDNAMLTAPGLAQNLTTGEVLETRNPQAHRPSRPSSTARQTHTFAQRPATSLTSFSEAWQPQARDDNREQTPTTTSDFEQEIMPETYPLGAAKAHLMGNYIVAENTDGMVIIDQHAAHERIVYEKLKQQWHDHGQMSEQPLLVPEVLRIDAEDLLKLEEHQELLEKMCFSFEAFGHDAVVLRSVPSLLAEGNKQKLLEDILAGIDEDRPEEGLQQRIYALLSRVACHGSIRSGRRLKPEEMNALLRQMEQTPNAGHCNHGRPTQIFLSKHEIEKLFGRKD